MTMAMNPLTVVALLGLLCGVMAFWAFTTVVIFGGVL